MAEVDAVRPSQLPALARVGSVTGSLIYDAPHLPMWDADGYCEECGRKRKSSDDSAMWRIVFSERTPGTNLDAYYVYGPYESEAEARSDAALLENATVEQGEVEWSAYPPGSQRVS